jgi:hypothetical protein
MSITDTMTHLIDLLETKVDWNKVFGVVEDLYNDPGFTSRADNFIVSSSVELALSEFSPLFRVDQIGYDFICEGTDAVGAEITVIGEYTGEAVELKMRKKLFYSPRGKNPHNTQDVKMKNFQGDKKTLQDFQEQKTFNKLIVLDLGGWEPNDYKVLVIDDEVARSRYYEKGDGIFAKFQLGDYYKCDIGEVNPARSDILLSVQIDQVKKNWIRNR